MAYLIAIIAGVVYGGADQYFGTVRLVALPGAWPSTVAQISAPWLLLPFVVCATQVRPRRAMLLGFAVTQAALIGYLAMTLSPMEGVPLSREPAAAIAFLHWNSGYVAAGAVTGVVYGLFGQRWRVRRAWSSAAMVVGALCLEPLSRVAVGQLFAPSFVWLGEVAVGVAVSVYFAMRVATFRRSSRSVT
jgi:Family of unknown function (DUF6518)